MEIRDLKDQLDIEMVAAKLGIQIDARTHRAKCSFHPDKTPSLQFSKEKQICTCFSSNCDAGTMDAINLVEKKLKLGTHEAIKWLEANCLNGESPKTPEKKEINETFPALWKVFKKNLSRSKPAQEYLKSRGLYEVETGYNSKAWDKMQNCVIFPLRNKQGEVVSFYGRSINGKGHYYNTNRQGLYPSYLRTETKRLILTESVIDAATLLQYEEITNEYQIIALYGTNGLTVGHREDLGSSQLSEVIIWLDGDASGREGAHKVAEEIKSINASLRLSIIDTEKGEDINSLAIKYAGNEVDFFLHEIENRRAYQESETVPESTIETSSGLDTKNPFNIIYATETATYYIKGGIKDNLDSLRITLVIEHPETNRKSRNKVDLFEDRQTEKTAKDAAERLNLRADLIARDLELLTDLLEEYREGANENEKDSVSPNSETSMTAEEREQAIDFLKRPELMERINTMIGKAGVVGEEDNRQLLFCVASSYKMPDTLHALVQGSSGSGKTHLIDKVMAFMPEQDTYRFTRITEGSLYNYGEYDLEHKLIGIEDYDGLEEKAELAFRELQSKGEISSSTSDKDDQTGRITGRLKRVRGPIASLAATTRGEVYEDNMSRCFLVAIDETDEQTHRIIDYQNNRRAGQINKQDELNATRLLQNCVKLLKPLEVINPYANRLSLPPEAHKIRRLNDLFQAFVNQITLINQYQRSRTESGQLITEIQDLEIAIEIMFESILLKVDELDGSLRHFYERLKEYVKKKGEGYEFSLREIRHELKISKTQQHRYIKSLTSLEYIRQTNGHANRGYYYKIMYWDSLSELRSRIKHYLHGQITQLALPLSDQQKGKDLAFQPVGTPTGTPETRRTA